MNENPFRAQLAKELKDTPKENRVETLNSARATEEYWQAKSEKLIQSAEWSKDKTELLWERKNVYHGTTSPTIENFNPAEESTIGTKAVYFTVDPKLAMGYARLRSEERNDEEAHLYEVGLNDIKLQNWAQLESVGILKKRFADHLQQAIKEMDSGGFENFAQKYEIHLQEQTVRKILNNTLAKIGDENAVHGGNIKTIAQGIPGIFFQDFVEKNGSDGVITIEGGDDQYHTSAPGVSVVVFNTEKIIWQKPYSLEENGG